MKTILLVENELNMLEIAGEKMNTFGYEVIPRTHAASVLSYSPEG
jgi:hypothetical protein